jgi:hypothetical protein
VERPLTFVQTRTDNPTWGKERDEPAEAGAKNPWPSGGWYPDTAGPERWGLPNAVFMALRVQVPVLELVAENDWEPATRQMDELSFVRISYANYASVMMLVNVVLIPLTIAGLTGYLKRRNEGA